VTDVFKCSQCGCRWTKASPVVGASGVWTTLNDKQVPYACCENEANFQMIEHLDPTLYPARIWDLDGRWKGETAALIGNAPSISKGEVDALPSEYRVIAVNQAVRYALDADLFVALDPHHPFWDRVRGFAGVKVLGVPQLVGFDYDLRDHDPLYAGLMYERADAIEIRNNMIAALRLAQRLGVSKVVLLGVDAKRYDRDHGPTGFWGFEKVLHKVVGDLVADGISVEVRGEQT
jgi:hypothetical protein